MKARHTTRIGWFGYYAKRAKESTICQAAHMALFYWLLHIEHDEPLGLT